MTFSLVITHTLGYSNDTLNNRMTIDTRLDQFETRTMRIRYYITYLSSPGDAGSSETAPRADIGTMPLL